MTMNNFPPGFLWGASTAPHQIEGNNINSDWWLQEQTVPGMEPAATPSTVTTGTPRTWSCSPMRA
ncbi:beta-Glucosidase [Arthrobacter sp. Hiyo8]|nr:beta-Glucosidase [Arthrobacter sp. Hiyo8]